MIAGISGHQELGDSTTIDWVRSAMETLVDQSSITLGLTSLAAGSDQLFASVLLGRQLLYDVVIPCQYYEETFDDVTLKTYQELLSRARQRITLPFPSPTEQAFWSAGQQIVNSSDLLLAVWDGLEARGLGGTGDVVSYALGVGRRVFHINPARRRVQAL